MKKALILSLTSLALAFCLTACGGSSADEQKDETKAPEETEETSLPVESDKMETTPAETETQLHVGKPIPEDRS